jgi:hypothetical protein
MKILKPLCLFIVIMLTVFSCNGQARQKSDTPPSHAVWDRLLKDHVINGMIDYQGFIKDKTDLDLYLNTLSTNAPDPDLWSEKEQLAYWINAYNAFTVKLIVDNYPLKSIEELHPTVHIPSVSTVWHKKFFTIGGAETSLDEIEHDILRKEFDEPRIHFAINCASFSCPPLRAEAFTADKLERQLEEMARQFINDPVRNKIEKDAIKISSIFNWFSGDFTKNGTLIDFLNKYSDTTIQKNADINYLPYDWALNDVK